ncbi:hypothetical protein L6R50_00965 [Myxococcota bacterium]|nr:hypothetical protein [Myxococcota bacterium]
MTSYILGISAWYHDSAAALVRDGVLVAAAAEERFTRKKHDASYPRNAVRYCLDQAGISPYELSHVVFYEKPWIKFERILTSAVATFPRSYRAFRRGIPEWLARKLWIGDEVRRELGVDRDCPVLFCEHHMAHAASAFLVSPFERAAILTLDGVGEWGTATGGVGEGNRILIDREIRFPHSLGLFYSALTAYLGFEVNDAEWKVMGLAPYGRPTLVDALRRMIDVAEDGSFRLDLQYFAHHRSVDVAFTPRWAQLLGHPPRDPESEILPFHQDLARSGQQVVEEVVVRLATDARRRTGADFLCLGGGVGLNSVANWRVLERSGFRDLFVQPASGDDGGAVGAAFWVWNVLLGGERRFRMEHARWGPAYSDEAIRAFLDAHRIPYRHLAGPDLVEATADLLAADRVVGWFQGRMEFGPRALGGRSILANPGSPAMKDLINQKVKFREAFRPFAPSVLEERAGELFDLHVDSPYMLLVPNVRPERRGDLPAVTHVDGTARVQTVDRDLDPLFHGLISAFDARTGLPAVVNTSFNVRGEPVVCTPRDAWNCFARSGIDALALGSFLVEDKGCGPVDAPWAFEHVPGRPPEEARTFYPPRARPSLLKTALEVLLVLAVVAELGARGVDRLWGHATAPVGLTASDPHQGRTTVPGARWGDRIHLDERGLRGTGVDLAPAPGVHRIAVLGGTAAFDPGAGSDALAWPSRLASRVRPPEGATGVEVVNAAVPGQTAEGALARLRNVVAPLRPAVVVLVPGAEDLAAARRRARGEPDVPLSSPGGDALRRLSRALGRLDAWLRPPDSLDRGPVPPDAAARHGATLRDSVALAGTWGARVLVVPAADLLPPRATADDRRAAAELDRAFGDAVPASLRAPVEPGADPAEAVARAISRR